MPDFLSLENEILFRKAIRNVYKHEGMAGIYACMKELNTGLKIAAEVAKEILEEEANDNH